MKNLIAFIIFLLPLFCPAQKTHTVAAKESLFSIGRLYNVHPKELAAYNHISYEAGLTLGQVLKIPAKKNSTPVADAAAITAPVKKEAAATVPVKKAATKAAAPVYHTVAKKEGLYSISKKYNASIADIKKWNNLSSEALSEGMNLIVGYSSTASPVQEVVAAPAAKKEPAAAKVAEIKTEIKVPVKEPAKIVKQEAENKMTVDFKGGYFKSLYDKQTGNNKVAEEKGMAGIFKSNSGWDDGKYYCLHNTAPAGSYIKITNSSTQKSVYAKVLDLIPDLKQNNKLIIRISNAAAAELGAGSADFNCSLNF